MWTTFIIYGVLLSAVVWVLQRRTWRLWVRLSLAPVLFSCFLLATYISSGPDTLGSQTLWYTESPWREAVLFVLMLLGMAARYLTKAIEARRERISELQKKGDKFKKPKLEFDAWEFSYPLLVSVVTFGALLSQIDESSPTLANLILSFQTGFFWQTILAAKQNSN